MNTHEEEIATSTVPAMAHRRGLIKAMAGGMVLAASSLFLPDRLEEVDAREGALDGAKGGRHSKNRKGRNRKRNRGHKNHKRKNRGKPDAFPNPFFGIEFQVEHTGGRSVKVDFYNQHTCTPSECKGSRWEFTDRATLGTSVTTHTFSIEVQEAALWIADKYLVRADNPPAGTPTVEPGYGGEFINYTFEGWRNGTSGGTHPLQEGESTPVLQVDGYLIQAKRLSDDTSNKRKVFKVTIAAPAA